ncbi:MAG: hypothetical protein JO087_10630, partial [Actinobacteria bacterium]|nr:hypothetical protein [Actinomycetota bacterium]
MIVAVLWHHGRGQTWSGDVGNALRDYAKAAGTVIVGAAGGVIFALFGALIIGPVALVLIRSAFDDEHARSAFLDFIVDVEGSVIVATGVG